MDLTDDEGSLSKEQKGLDEHDDLIADLTVPIKQLISTCTAPPTTPRNITARRLARVQKALSEISSTIAALTSNSDDRHLLRQFEEQLADVKGELSDTRSHLLESELEESNELMVLQATLEKDIINLSVKIKKELSTSASASTTPPSSVSENKGVKLPKLDVPTFYGNILNWCSFWEQLSMSIHSRSSLSNSEKFVYLQRSLRDGSAKDVIEGLSRSGNNYAEVIKCLQSRYNRPCLMHQTHVRIILEAPALKDGTGKELCCLHDSVQPLLHALKAMGYEPSGPFIMSVLELKLDANTMFKWQRHSQESTDIPNYSTLLEFLNL